MRHEITTRRVLYEIPGMAAILGRDAEFPAADGAMLPMRLYSPLAAGAGTRAAVVIVAGYPDAGFTERLGCRFMDMDWSISMAQLLAASGFTAITHSNRQPQADAIALLRHLTSEGWTVGIWATSGHGPVAMAAVDHAICGVLTNPVVGSSVVTRPLFLVRSGRDATPGLNAALDAFVHDSLVSNCPLTLINLPDAPHSFELFHDTVGTRQVLRQAVQFLRAQLGVEIP